MKIDIRRISAIGMKMRCATTPDHREDMLLLLGFISALTSMIDDDDAERSSISSS